MLMALQGAKSGQGAKGTTERERTRPEHSEWNTQYYSESGLTLIIPYSERGLTLIISPTVKVG
jgi:hypothetical protein